MQIPTGITLGSTMRMKDVFREILIRKANGIFIIRRRSLLAGLNSENAGVTENSKITGEDQTKPELPIYRLR